MAIEKKMLVLMLLQFRFQSFSKKHCFWSTDVKFILKKNKKKKHFFQPVYSRLFQRLKLLVEKFGY